MSRRYGLLALIIFSLLLTIVPQTYKQINAQRNPFPDPQNPGPVMGPSFPPAQPRRSNLPPKQISLKGEQKKLKDEQKKLIAGSAEDQAKYAAFLRQPDTGLFRLFPKADYQNSLMVDAQALDRSLPVLGGGAYYSFGNKSHIFGPWSDICLQDNGLFTQVASASLGLFTLVGDMPLDSITLQTPGVDFLTKMTIPTQVPETIAQAKRNVQGFQEGAFTYRSGIRIFLNQTYILRTIVYKRRYASPELNPISGEAMLYSKYEGADLLIAFRVVRQEEDGTVTILWKRLQESSGPQFKRNKK